ncbi:MAG: hypothetical protein IT252_12820 [Chitinophagaceae bacterium]|nr:hypothetical protein [Chitinophagaceae bacterium]
MSKKHHFFLQVRQLMLLAIFFFPLALMAQKKVTGVLINKQRSAVLSKGFKKVEVYDINAADIAQFARGNGKAPFELTLTLGGNQPFALQLFETNLLADDYQLIVADGNNRQTTALPNCKTYSGIVLNDSGSTVFLTMSDKTINGFIKRGNKQYHIEPLRYFDKDAATSNFILYEAGDVIQNSNQTCGVTELEQKMAQFSGNGIQPLGEATGICKVTDVGIASDRSMVNKYGSAALVEEHNISVMNMVVGLYRNAQIGSGYLAFRIRAQYVSMNTAADPLSPAYNGIDADSLLIRFSQWAKTSGFSTVPDLLQMWTARDFGRFAGPGQTNFNRGVIGLAYLDAVCNPNYKFQILEAYTGLNGMSLGILVAHEIGHNFGAGHDGDGNAENPSAYIMASSLNPGANSFSNTSLQVMTNYTNAISCLSSCSGVTIPEFNASSTAICTGNSVTFTNATVSDVPHSLASFVWRLPGGNPSTSTAISPTVSYATPGRKTVTLEVGNQSVTKEIFVGNAPTQACRTLTPKNADQSGLLSFSFGSIGYKASNVIINGEYKNLACSLNTILTPGSTYTISAGLGFPLTTPITSRLQLFLDYNNDGDFLDANEMLYTGSECKSGIDTVVYTAPANINLTDTWLRLRVVAAPCNVANSDGCALSGNANVFDFAVSFKKPPPCILYVNANATGNNDGSSWANAYTNIQTAINAATCFYGNEIWVAKGTYKPTAGVNRDSAFVMKNKVAIYGGFAGTETQLVQRNWGANPTILSGDIGVLNNINDNSYHVVLNNQNGLDSTAVLDGFIIRDGNAYKGEYIGNRGGGIHNLNSAPAIYNCIITGNNAAEYGGGVFNQSAAPKMVNCVIAGNTAWFGGGLYNESAATELTNCTFSGNLVTYTGAAMYTYGAVSPKVTNSIIWGNGSGIQNAGGATPIVSYSIVQGGYTGTSNLNVDPLFVQQPLPGLGNLGNLRLRTVCSPAVNAGLNNAFTLTSIFDLDRGARFNRTAIDLGAYEYPGNGDVVIYIDANATGNKTGYSWKDAYTNLAEAMNDLNLCSPVNTYVYVAAGTYTLPANLPLNISVTNARMVGGFPTGGAASPNANANPVIIKGDVRVLKSMTINGVRIEKQ